VIHGFNKEQREPVRDIVKKAKLLDNTLPAVQLLVSGVADLLGKRSNNQAWGRFGNDGRQGPFPDKFAQFANAMDSEANFLALSHLVVDQLVEAATSQVLSTGGRILFSLFDDAEAGSIFMIAMIKQKGGVVLNDDFVPIDIVEIDLSKLHQASQIRIDHFLSDQKIDSAANHEDQDRNYLSFLSPKSSTHASGYFISALGCVIGITPAKATNEIFAAVDAFLSANAELKAYRKPAKEKVTEYLQMQLGKNEPASLDFICEVLRGVVGPEHVAHMDDVLPFLNGPKHKIPDEFQVHGASLKKHSKISLENDRLNLKFVRSDLGTTLEAKIGYDKEKRTLTIRNLSDDFIAKLDQTLATG
jgi:nucleoid-associated protein